MCCNSNWPMYLFCLEIDSCHPFSLVISMSAACSNGNTFREIKGLNQCDWSQLELFLLTTEGVGAPFWSVHVQRKGRSVEEHSSHKTLWREGTCEDSYFWSGSITLSWKCFRLLAIFCCQYNFGFELWGIGDLGHICGGNAVHIHLAATTILAQTTLTALHILFCKELVK